MLLWNFNNSFKLQALIKGFNLHLFLLLWLKKKSILLEDWEYSFLIFFSFGGRVWSRREWHWLLFAWAPNSLLSAHFFPFHFRLQRRPKGRSHLSAEMWNKHLQKAGAASALLSLGKENGAWARERESQRNERIICSTHCSFKSRDVNNVYNPVLKLYYNVLMIKRINNLHKCKNNWCETYCKKNENSNHRFSH